MHEPTTRFGAPCITREASWRASHVAVAGCADEMLWSPSGRRRNTSVASIRSGRCVHGPSYAPCDTRCRTRCRAPSLRVSRCARTRWDEAGEKCVCLFLCVGSCVCEVGGAAAAAASHRSRRESQSRRSSSSLQNAASFARTPSGTEMSAAGMRKRRSCARAAVCGEHGVWMRCRPREKW